MSGLGQLVPYFECQYPQVLPMGLETFEAVVNSSGAQSQASAAQGMGDYLDPFVWPIPQYLTPGNNRGLGCADCGGSCGLGDIAITAPGGYFSTMDISQWGVAEWGSVAAGLYFVSSLVGDTKRGVKKARRSLRKRA